LERRSTRSLAPEVGVDAGTRRAEILSTARNP
jgi:hypothetical protein